MNEVNCINWMQSISVYETARHVYLIGSDLGETQFRLVKINRAPVDLYCSPQRSPDNRHHRGSSKRSSSQDQDAAFNQQTIEAESLFDRLWRLEIVEDPHVYTSHEIVSLLKTIDAANYLSPSCGQSRSTTRPSTDSTRGGLLSTLFNWTSTTTNRTVGDADHHRSSPGPSSLSSISHHSSSSSSTTSRTTVCQRLTLTASKCPGLIGVVRFLFGYYLLVITKAQLVAILGEHRIFKVEDVSMIYLPGSHSPASLGSAKVGQGHIGSAIAVNDDDDLIDDEADLSSLSCIRLLQQQSPAARSRLLAEEARLVKLFNSVDLASNFYFSYTYDLSNSLQFNMQPVFTQTDSPTKSQSTLLVRPLINNRFVWNWDLIPPRLRPGFSPHSASSTRSKVDWFLPLFHGCINQGMLVACGSPLAVTLIARRSRRFAGPRFLKRGVNLVGDVANEVEIEQIVNDTTSSRLQSNRCAAYIQMRGSVPLFWSQNSSKVVVGRPPIEINRIDPYYESFGFHFAEILARFGSPVVVLNLLKGRDRSQSEGQLTDGYLQGLTYLSQFLPQSIVCREPCWPSNDTSSCFADSNKSSSSRGEGDPPFIYVGFDVARVQKSKTLVVLDQLRPVIDGCIKRTGLFVSIPPMTSSSKSSSCGTSIFNQHGIIRVNCVDCLDRTNTSQFVVGRVALAYQLDALGLLSEPNIRSGSPIETLLEELYDEVGDTLALQYGGSQLVHNIKTYKKTRSFTSHSRDFLQTLTRYYANTFSDWDKQCATNLFLRLYRPIPLPTIVGSSSSSASSSSLSGTTTTLYHLLMDHVRADTYLLPSEFDPRSYDRQLTLLACSSSHVESASTGGSSGGGDGGDGDGALHWLEAWSRLATRRFAFTSWAPPSLIESLPQGLAGRVKRYVHRQLMNDRSCGGCERDLSTDWFHEIYQPGQYQELPSTSLSRLNWVQLVPLLTPLTRVGGRNTVPRSLLSSPPRLTAWRSLSDTTVPSLDAHWLASESRRQSLDKDDGDDYQDVESTFTKADLSEGHLKSRHATDSSNWMLMAFGSSGKVNYPMSGSGGRTKPIEGKKQKGTKVKKSSKSSHDHQQAGSDGGSSSDSDSQPQTDDTGAFLCIYPPDCLSMGTGGGGAGSSAHQQIEHQQTRHSSLDEQYSSSSSPGVPANTGWSQSQQLTSTSLFGYTTSAADRKVYHDYLYSTRPFACPLTSSPSDRYASITSMPPVTLEPVSDESMKIYRNYLDLTSRTISRETLLAYSAR